MTFDLQKEKKHEILYCIQVDEQLNKSNKKNEKEVKEQFFSKPTQNESLEFLLKLSQSDQEYCELLLNLQITFDLNP